MKNGNYYKWFRSIKHKTIYIPKSNVELAENLAQKKYVLARIKDLTKEQKALQAYNKSMRSPKCNTNRLLSNPGVVQLLSNQNNYLTKESLEWLSEDYQRNTNYPERLKFNSVSGNVLRSKTEAIIDTALFQYKIPFRYEAALTINGITIFPDFTARHPVNGKIYYWEHFGLLEKEEYRQKYVQKINLYTANGIIPSINLITSYETVDNPFTPYEAEQIIHKYFL